MAQGNGPNGNRRGLLLGLAVVVLIVVAAAVLIRELGASARMQDCLLTGRTNCAPIQQSSR